MTIAQSFDGFTGLSPDDGDLNDPQHSLFDDDLLLDDANGLNGAGFNDFNSANRAGSSSKKSSANSRKGPHAADKRAVHNAIERARRESLNGRFMVSSSSGARVIKLEAGAAVRTGATCRRARGYFSAINLNFAAE